SFGAGDNSGHEKARSMRSCCPAWRCSLVRIAAGGTSNSTPPTVTGRAGTSRAGGSLGQVGHNREETQATAAATVSTRRRKGAVSKAVLPRRIFVRGRACAVMLLPVRNESRRAVLHGLLGC